MLYALSSDGDDAAQWDKPTVVLLHGLFGMAENLRSLRRIYTPYFNVISYDLPNHGRSPTLHDCTFPRMAELLHKTLCAEIFSHTTSVHLCGHSLGGKLAAVYALLYPHRTASLLMIDIAPVEYPPHYLKEIEALRVADAMLREANAEENRLRIKEAMRVYVKDPLVCGFLAKNIFRKEDGTMGMYARIETIAENYDLLRGFPHKELGEKKYHGSMLCIRGGKSDFVSRASFTVFDIFFPRWKMKTIDTAGHMVHADAPHEIATLLTDYYRPLVG